MHVQDIPMRAAYFVALASGHRKMQLSLPVAIWELWPSMIR